MAYPRYQQPLITNSTGLRLPAPAATSPLYSSGWNPSQGNIPRLPTPTPPPGGGVVGPRGTQTTVLPKQPVYKTPWKAPTPPKTKLEVSPYMETMYKSIQNIDPEQRAEYLQTTAASIKDRLDTYEFRIARGIPLTPEQQRQYDSIRNAYNDIQKYINNPTLYDEFFAGTYSRVQQNPGRLNQALSIQNIDRS